MMNTTQSETTLRQDLAQLARYHLRGWRGPVALATLLAVPALWLGGPWLIAAGAVPLLISLAPCLAMCALGLCAMRNCSKGAAARGEVADAVPAPASTPAVTPALADRSREASVSPRA